ncbi:hypothetical protein FACS1894103_7240 [Campylobacterota bacterium]|nr:hypothetical protein FACS1894103_7240 [Campylobacterota bacterium]
MQNRQQQADAANQQPFDSKLDQQSYQNQILLQLQQQNNILKGGF